MKTTPPSLLLIKFRFFSVQGMGIIQVLVVTIAAIRIELVSCNLDLKCKAREGCHFSGCDPTPLSLSSLDRNEFPITCQEKTTVKNEADALLTMLVEQDKRKSEQIKTLTIQVVNLAKETAYLRKGLQLDTTTPVPETTKIPVLSENCRNIPLSSAKFANEKGGVFDINIPGFGLKEVFCDTTTDGGGWVVFQRRMNGSVDFYGVWSDYVDGFGNRNGEFWLGLEAIHQLTKAGQHEFRVDMVKTNGNRYYLKCSSFRIEAASDNYRLRVSGCSGTAAGFFFTYQNNIQFSTRDRDNDQYSGNCASSTHKHGAWWYKSCSYINFNGQYGVSGRKGISWNGEVMRFTEMKVRQKL